MKAWRQALESVVTCERNSREATASVDTRAITGIRYIDPDGGTLRNNPGDDYHEIGGSFVSYEMTGRTGIIDERSSGWNYLGRASGVVPLIFRGSAG